MNLKITKAQLKALINIVDELDATLGSGENDSQRVKWIKMMDKMLEENNIKR